MADGLPVLCPGSALALAPRARRPWERALKAGLDWLIALPALIVLAPIGLVIALLIKLDSPGPVIHRRRVLGLHGRPFDAFKLRTMHVDQGRILAGRPDLRAELALRQKLTDDPRVTRLGRVLRRASLDELPQLFNVLRREMSLVGPRMISPEELGRYGDSGALLLSVRPGITGLWQVSGRSETTYERRVELDVAYLRSWSIGLDLRLLWRTIPAVLSGRGAC